MHRVLTVLVAGLLLGAAVEANPIVPTLINEIQVAPDSLERIELNTRYWPGGYQDFSGWQVITSAGTAIIDSGIVATDTDDYVVLDRHNVSGTFSLGDSEDMIIIKGASHESVAVSYPGPFCNLAQCWCPPPGMSVARIVHTVTFPEPDIIYNWYFDATPSFGAANDDSLGGIFGAVLNQQAEPLCSAVVRIDGPGGGSAYWTDAQGHYAAHPTGQGTFWVTATKGGQTGEYPESVAVTQNESRDGIDIIVPYTGANESPAVRLKLDWRGGWLRVSADRPVRADLSVVNAAGRSCGRLRTMLTAGESELHPLSALPAGVYLVQGTIGKEKVNRKVAVFR
jgi:hypothetical protein